MDPDVYAPEANKTYYFFPRLFPEDSCRRIKQKQGSWMYSMLYLNNPKDPSLAEFPMNRVQDFEFDDEGNLSLHNADGTHETVIFDSLRRVQIWDPALGEKDIKKNSRNALVVMYGDSKGRLFIAEGYAERKDPTLLFTRFIGFHQRHHLHRSAIEDAGFQRVLKFPLYHKMREMGISFPVHDQKPIGEKDARIRSLIPYAETYSLYIRRGLSDVREEMRQFPVFLTKDLLDAAAACVELLGTAQASGRRVGATAANSRAEVARLATRTSVTGY
jgi:predicted phage terminase large subunit-like protein